MALRKPNKRQGFSLIELLVVVAIIGVRVALLLGGIYKTREASNRIACMNNMRQLGAAFQNYHLTHKEFPTEAGANPSFYEALLPFVEQQNADASTQVNVYLCPGRRTANAGAKRDFGYAATDGANVMGPSILDFKAPTDTSAKPAGVSMDVINSYSGAQNTIMLTHVWMAPTTYTGGDATDVGWASKNNSRSDSSVTKHDADKSGDTSLLGGPHPKSTPTLYVDGHVESVPYQGKPNAENWWSTSWAFKIDESGMAGVGVRWVRVWNAGSASSTTGGASGSTSSADSKNSGNSLGPVANQTTTVPSGYAPSTQTTPSSLAPQVTPVPSTRTDSQTTPASPNTTTRAQPYQDAVDAEAAKRAGQAQQAANSAASAAAQAAKDAQSAQAIVAQIGKGGDKAQIAIIASQDAANAAKAAADAAKIPDATAAQTAANNASSAASTARNALNQVQSMVPSTTTTTTTTTTPVVTTTPTPPTTTTTTSTPPTTTTTTSTPPVTTTSTPPPSTSTTPPPAAGGGSGGGFWEWIAIPW